MTIEAELPDGTVLEFPDGTSPLVMQAAAQRQMGGQKSAPKRPSTMLDKATGFMANVNRGLVVGDEIAGGLKGAGNAVGALMAGKGLSAVPGAFQQGMQDQRSTEDAFQASNPNMAALGRGIGNAGTLAVPGGKGVEMLANAPRALNAARGAVSAGVQGMSMAALDRGGMNDRLKAMSAAARDPALLAVGATAGALAPARARPIKPAVRPEVAELVKRGVQVTPGQAMGGVAKTFEDAATSLPIAGNAIQEARTEGIKSFGRALADDALSHIGQKSGATEAGHDLVSSTYGKFQDHYKELIPQGGMRVDQELGDAITDLAPAISTLQPQNAQQLKNIIESRLTSRINDGALDGKTFQKVQSELNFEKGRFEGSKDPDHQLMGNIFQDIRDALHAAAGRQDEGFAAAKKATDTGYAKYKRLEGAASSIGAEEGVPTPAQYLQSIRRADNSVDKGAFGRGEAFGQDFAKTAKSVLPSKLPDSGTPTRAMLGALVSAPGAILGGAAGGGAGAAAGLAGTMGALGIGAKAYSPKAMGLYNKALSEKVSTQDARMALQELKAAAAKDKDLLPLLKSAYNALLKGGSATLITGRPASAEQSEGQ